VDPFSITHDGRRQGPEFDEGDNSPAISLRSYLSSAPSSTGMTTMDYVFVFGARN